MKKTLTRLPLAFRAIRELGPSQTFWYAVYQLGLRSGWCRRATQPGDYPVLPIAIHTPFALPNRQTLAAVLGDRTGDLIAEADEIIQGQVRLFGGPPVPLKLVPPDASQHWTAYENRPDTWGVEDIKFIWEPARFGWVYPLGRAYYLTGDEKYRTAFWQYLEAFFKANPLNQGPNWASAQEVALRLLALLFAAHVFEPPSQSTPERTARLAGILAAHAQRIPPTLSYARAQDNNHRVSEALGLYAAGCALLEHPQAVAWQTLGWREINQALQSQIQPDGTYAQHSLNYHRLMLHDALQAALFGRPFPEATRQRLADATLWLIAQVDPRSGLAPNLGSNDGANILPLAQCGFTDYRPVAQAAARAFLGHPAFPPGPWDEPGLWLGQSPQPVRLLKPQPANSAIHRLGSSNSWATLRAVHFHSRPSHADQLHVDLWWRGENIAMDAGTYRYTASPPWDNALSQTFVHNTVEVNGQSQMQRAGRFLWLDWAQASILKTVGLPGNAIGAQHNGYLHLGVLHRRILKMADQNHWQVIDYLLRGEKQPKIIPDGPLAFRLNWLLPDWPWSLDSYILTLKRPGGGQVRLAFSTDLPASPACDIESVSLVRAGQVLAGPEKVSPLSGWFSPTYDIKVPAVSFSVTVRAPLPFSMMSAWTLEDQA